MKKLLLLALAFFGLGGASVASATTVIADEPAPTPYEEQLRTGAQLSHRHHGYHHRHHRYRGYYDGYYYYYYPRRYYRDYYYYY